jgi:hypothetical protein
MTPLPEELTESIDILLVGQNNPVRYLTIDASSLYFNIGEAIRHLTKILEDGCTLEELELTGVKYIIDAVEVAKIMAEALKATKCKLKKLNIHDCEIGDVGATYLAVALEKNEELTELKLSNCHISDAGASRLAEALLKNSTLQRINIMGNKIGAKGLKSFLPVVSKNRHLTHIYLGYRTRAPKVKQMLLDDLLANSLALQDADGLFDFKGAKENSPEYQVTKIFCDRNRLFAQYKDELMRNITGLCLACGLHPKCGANSPISAIPQEVLQEICSYYVCDNDETFYSIARKILKASEEEIKTMGFNEKSLEHIKQIKEAHRRFMRKLWLARRIKTYQKVLRNLGLSGPEIQDEIQKEILVQIPVQIDR